MPEEAYAELPPINACFSTIVTFPPRSTIVNAAVSPANPLPMIMASALTCSGSRTAVAVAAGGFLDNVRIAWRTKRSGSRHSA